MTDGYWTYKEWAHQTVEKIVTLGLAAPEEHRADYLRVQIAAAIGKALRHGRSGRSDDDPVTPWAPCSQRQDSTHLSLRALHPKLDI